MIYGGYSYNSYRFQFSTAKIPFQSDEDFSSKENVVADEYFLSESEGVRGVVLTLILVPLAHVPLIYQMQVS